MNEDLFQRYYAALLYDEEEGYEYVIESLTDHLADNPSNAAARSVRQPLSA